MTAHPRSCTSVNMVSVDTTNAALANVKLRIHNRGPEYVRERLLKRDSGLIRSHRKSAVELLEESKPLYVKSETVLDHKQHLKNTEVLHVGHRRLSSTSQDETQRQDKVIPNSRSFPGSASSQSNSTPSTNQMAGHQSSGSKDKPPVEPTLWRSTQCDSYSPSQDDTSEEEEDSFPYESGFATILKRPKHANDSESDRKVKKTGSSEGDKKSNGEAEASRTDTSSDLDQQSGSSSAAKLDDNGLVVVRRRPKKSISRSRSDLSHRYSNSSELSELSARFSRNSADLEKFFNEMGLDRSVLDPMLNSGQYMSGSSADLLHIFDSVSSLDSPDARSMCSGDSKQSETALNTTAIQERTSGQSHSVVERNARIIKWLCSVKKAHSTSD